MHVLILGYGYAGYYCAKNLLANGHQVMGVSRTYPDDYQLAQLKHVCSDIRVLDVEYQPDTVIYCAPPPSEGVCDTLLTEVLAELTRINLVANIVYWGSSGVYGDHAGCWVDEESPCFINSDLQRRRLDAEDQVRAFADKHQVAWSVMRVAGMFGPGRMPSTNKPVIVLSEAPYSNLVYIEDAAQVAVQAALQNKALGILNVSDGLPKKMGALQRMVAEHQGVVVHEQRYHALMESASPMRQYFLGSSKRLSNKKCKTLFPEIVFADFETMVKQCFIK
ncbi:MAG: NAD-dependent epimerase/dehydratase family protein [Legionellaceae bacterium]|nr:NAD-dependent epimerase/dehydratase family protein [Legionellaceae bacterium]